MSGSWEFVLNQSSVEYILSLRPKERERILSSLAGLLDNPHRAPDFAERGASGRSYSVVICGPYSITYWLDPMIQELRVVRILKSRSQTQS